MGHYLQDMSVRPILGRTNLTSARDLLAVPNNVGGLRMADYYAFSQVQAGSLATQTLYSFRGTD